MMSQIEIFSKERIEKIQTHVERLSSERSKNKLRLIFVSGATLN